MKTIIALSLGLLSLASVASGTPSKVSQCNVCHGKNGAAPIMDTYPKLNGQNKGYLVSALKDYRGGKRTGVLSAVMTAQSASLTDQEIEELSAFYSSIK